MNANFKTMLVGGAAVVAAALAFTGQANAAPTWQVDDNVSPAGVDSVYNVDTLAFTYSSTINQVIAGGDGFAGADDIFTETSTAAANSYTLGGAPSLDSYLNAPGGMGYGLNATFTGTGETSVIDGQLAAVFDSFTVDLYFDNDGGTSTDTLFATATMAGPSVVLLDQILSADGNYSVLLDVTLLPGFEDYWIPSQMLMVLAGNVDELAIPQGLVNEEDGNYNMEIVDAVTNLKATTTSVPEPASLSLLGIGLLGLGLLSRRRLV